MRNSALIVIVLLILVAAGGAYWFFLPGDETPEPATPSAATSAPQPDTAAPKASTPEPEPAPKQEAKQAQPAETAAAPATKAAKPAAETSEPASDGAGAAADDSAQAKPEPRTVVAATATLSPQPAAPETAASETAAAATSAPAQSAAPAERVAETAGEAASKAVETARAAATEVEKAAKAGARAAAETVRKTAEKIAEPAAVKPVEASKPAAPEPVAKAPAAEASPATTTQKVARTSAPATPKTDAPKAAPAKPVQVAKAPQATAPAGEGATAKAEIKAPAAETKVARSVPALPSPPSFDIVRIATDGTAVLAGRAPKRSAVRLLDGGEVRARTEANRSGEWSLVLLDPLPPGERSLLLIATLADGREVRADSVLVVIVPEPPANPKPKAVARAAEPAAKPQPEAAAPAQQAVAVVVPKQADAPVRVLQGPGSSSEGGLALTAVSYDEAQRPVLSGRAGAGNTVRAYLNNGFVGEGRTADAGDWRIGLPGSVTPGDYRLRLDEVRPDGKVVARREMPFTRVDPRTLIEVAQTEAREDSVVVQPGNSLWRIARRVYGEGIRYVEIYRDNADKIRDPDLIYPGQIFTLPSR